jgi:segregation and condensation protein B
MEVRLEKEAALVETVLFLESEALDETALSRITGLSRDVIDGALELLCEECHASQSRGVEPVRSGGGWILAPKAELWESLKERYGKKNESRLSRAALETLSIIAYSQPITRPEIEAIRGVSADGMIRFLLDREFIKEVGKKEAPGRPVQYGTTKEFLKYFRLGSIAELPRLDELEEGRFGEEREEEESVSVSVQPEVPSGEAQPAADAPSQEPQVSGAAMPAPEETEAPEAGEPEEGDEA